MRALQTLLGMCILIASCTRGEEQEPPRLNDTARIISLSPSITRQLIDLNSDHLLAGVTTHSPSFSKRVPIVGSIVRPNLEAILLLKPDLVLCSEEDSAVQHLESFNALCIPLRTFPRSKSFEEMCANFMKIGILVGKERLSGEKIKRYRSELDLLREKASALKARPRTVIFIAHRPLISVSGRSFINGIIIDAGGINVYGDINSPYPVVSLESLVERHPEVVIATSDEALEYIRGKAGALLQRTGAGTVSWHVVPPDHLSFYTPSDYVESVRIISSIMAGKE